MEKVVHKVLALKYRPKNFNELIGQDVAVETIKNSILSKNLPNAYLLSGIRGVGKDDHSPFNSSSDKLQKKFYSRRKM